MVKDATKFDVAIVGAGPAGIMAAIQAAKAGLSVVLLEKNPTIGKKLLLTGGGRCNFTNAEFNLKELAKNYNHGEFLFYAFSKFGVPEVINFFESLGIKTKIEKDKRVFPKSDNSQEVLEALKKCLAGNKVNVIYGSEVKNIICKGNEIDKLILQDKEIKAQKYVLAAGGRVYPQTGSNGSGFNLAEKLGHTIVKPGPALSPLIIKEQWVKRLQGIGLKDVRIDATQDGKKQFHEEGEIVFTHFGISGPAILNISGRVGDLLEKGEVKISIDLFPLLNREELLQDLEDILKRKASKTIKNVLASFAPERLAEVLMEENHIDKDKKANDISKLEKGSIVKVLKDIEMTVGKVIGFDQALVTRGGVSLREIDHKTMRSKIINNLFFAGEIIDIDGKTGGFNLQACWSSGYLAGKNCIK